MLSIFKYQKYHLKYVYNRLRSFPKCCYHISSIKYQDNTTATYERKTPVEHVLLRPGMYVGQIEIDQTETWVYNKEKGCMNKETLKYSPALLKIFDEIIVNAADNRHRDNNMSIIDVNFVIDFNKGDITISVKNDGKGIPIAIHGTENIYIPE